MPVPVPVRLKRPFELIACLNHLLAGSLVAWLPGCLVAAAGAGAGRSLASNSFQIVTLQAYA
jgi:hypothetical protein